MAGNNTREQIDALAKSVEQLQAMMQSVIAMSSRLNKPVQQKHEPRSMNDIDPAELEKTHGPWRLDPEEFAVFREECEVSKRNLAIAKLLALNLDRVTTFYEGELYAEWRKATPRAEVEAWWKNFNGKGIPEGL